VNQYVIVGNKKEKITSELLAKKKLQLFGGLFEKWSRAQNGQGLAWLGHGKKRKKGS